MEKYKFENIKQTKTAIHCPTQEEYDKVYPILAENGFEFMKNKNHWGGYNKEFCFFTDQGLQYGDREYANNNTYTIISAQDFINANSIIMQEFLIF